jgi:hypothetical protein
MTKIVLGEQEGESTSDLALDTDGASNLEVHGGKLRDRAKENVRILDRSNPAMNASVPLGADVAAASTTPSASNPTTPAQPIKMGVFLLIGLAVIASVFVAMVKYVDGLWIPVVLVATLLGLYFLASAILPRENVANLSGFASSLKDFMGHILGKPSGGK